MKKLLLVILLALMVSAVHAQYRKYKNLYNVKEYKYQKTDRYNPTTAGFMSIVPVLGHCYVGEPLRGFGFLGLMYGSLGLTVYGVSEAWHPGNTDIVGWMVGGGTLIFIGSYIWSIADVTRVAKIKNMAFRDKKLAIHLSPSLQTYSNENTLGASIRGATLRINF